MEAAKDPAALNYIAVMFEDPIEIANSHETGVQTFHPRNAMTDLPNNLHAP
jgi:hypothetical protein